MGLGTWDPMWTGLENTYITQQKVSRAIAQEKKWLLVGAPFWCKGSSTTDTNYPPIGKRCVRPRFCTKEYFMPRSSIKKNSFICHMASLQCSNPLKSRVEYTKRHEEVEPWSTPSSKAWELERSTLTLLEGGFWMFKHLLEGIMKTLIDVL